MSGVIIIIFTIIVIIIIIIIIIAIIFLRWSGGWGGLFTDAHGREPLNFAKLLPNPK